MDENKLHNVTKHKNNKNGNGRKDGHSPFNRDPLHSFIHPPLTPNLL